MNSEHDNSYRDYGDSCSGVYPDLEFEGLLVERWPNGELKYRGQFKKRRKRIGQHICFHENGVLQEVGYWDDGWVCGTLIWFNEDGTKESEKDYGEYGGRTRSWVEKWYDADGQLWRITVWRNDLEIAEWVEAESRKRWEEIQGDKIVDEAVKQVYPDIDEEDASARIE